MWKAECTKERKEPIAGVQSRDVCGLDRVVQRKDEKWAYPQILLASDGVRRKVSWSRVPKHNARDTGKVKKGRGHQRLIGTRQQGMSWDAKERVFGRL